MCFVVFSFFITIFRIPLPFRRFDHSQPCAAAPPLSAPVVLSLLSLRHLFGAAADGSVDVCQNDLLPASAGFQPLPKLATMVSCCPRVGGVLVMTCRCMEACLPQKKKVNSRFHSMHFFTFGVCHLSCLPLLYLFWYISNTITKIVGICMLPQYGKQRRKERPRKANRWWVVAAQRVACKSVNSSTVSTQHSFFTCATACVPWWVWPGGSDSSCFCCSHPCGGFPPLGGVSSLPSLGTAVCGQVLCTLHQPSEVHYTLRAYWYEGTPHSDHVAPNLTCIQCPLPRPSPLLQSTSSIQLRVVISLPGTHGQEPLPNLLLPNHLGAKLLQYQQHVHTLMTAANQHVHSTHMSTALYSLSFQLKCTS